METLIERNKFREMVEGFSSLRIAVAGDLFLDKWLEIDRSFDEPSLETGLTAYQVIRKRLYPGAAGTVLSDLAALGAGRLYAVSFTGDDGEGYDMRLRLSKMGVHIDHVVVSDDVMTPTYTKPVFLKDPAAGGAAKLEETNRLDHRNVSKTPAAIEDRIIDSLEKLSPEVDALIALDQITAEGYGVLTPRVREALSKIGRENKKLILYADSRAFIAAFKNTIIKCNDHEAILMVRNKQIPPEELADLDEAGECLLELSKNSGKEVFVSCGSRGVLVKGRGGKPALVPAVPVSGPIDIVGAGDACTSGIVSALCRGASPEEAAFTGNLTASITIQVIGATGTASCEQLLRRYDEFAACPPGGAV